MVIDLDKYWYVHYAASPLDGEWLIPWDELRADQRDRAGHQGRVHEKRFREQWRSDRAYVHELPIGFPVLHIGTGYSCDDCWAYRVEPMPPLELDPERNGHLVTSRICPRARIAECLHRPIGDGSSVS